MKLLSNEDDDVDGGNASSDGSVGDDDEGDEKAAGKKRAINQLLEPSRAVEIAGATASSDDVSPVEKDEKQKKKLITEL